MRKFLLLVFLPLFLGSTAGTRQGPPIKVPLCDCPDSNDTVLPDTSKAKIIHETVTPMVDSFMAVKQKTLDSLNEVKDSLKVEIEILRREKGKHVIVGQVDEIPATETKHAETWQWLFWKFKDGTTRYYKVLKIKH